MGTVKIIAGRNGRLWPAVLRSVRESRARERRIVLYVPEQLTLQTERDLITDLNLKGLLDLEVISPRKLRQRVREAAGSGSRNALDDLGKALAVHRAMTETAEELHYYRNMTELPGAVGRVREALAELQESEWTPEDLAEHAGSVTGSAQKAKILDLSRIWSAYSALVAERFEDEKTAWTDLVNRLEKSEVLHGADLMVYGFDSIRPDLRELLVRAAGVTEEILVFLMMDQADAPDGMLFEEQRRSMESLRVALREAGQELRISRETFSRNCAPELAWLERQLFAREPAPWPEKPENAVCLYAGAGPWEEAERITGRLREWHREGIPWERMAVALPKESDLEGVLRSRLTLNEIPFYAAEKIPAAAHGVSRMLLGALACISEGYTAADVTAVARSGFCTLTEEEGQQIEAYALAHGIEGSRWRKPFEKGTDAAAAEALRQKLLAPMEELRKELKGARTAAASVEALVHFLEAEGVWKRLQEREEELLEAEMYREAVADRQVWQLLMELLDRLWTLLGERRTSLRDLKSMLEGSLGSAPVATLPETESGVILGEVGHMLAGDTEALVLAGCQEGILSAPESGWLPDRERNALEHAGGKEIGLSRERRGWIRRCDYYRTLTLPTRHLMVSWSLRDDAGSPRSEDGLIGRLRMVFPLAETEGGVTEKEDPTHPETPLKALETMGRAIRETPESVLIALLHSESCGQTARAMLTRTAGEKASLSPETARRLFHTDVLSISRLERYAACPYRHFIEYGLRPVRQETFSFEDSDAGVFFHAALDRFMKDAGAEREWPDLSDEKVDGMMDAICAELTREWEEGPLREDALGIWQGEDCLRRVHYAARVLTRFAANSDFRTIVTEQSFGTVEKLPPLRLRLADGSETAIRGIIDRIDTYRSGEGVWLRVVDNKSGFKKPDAAKMADGEQLQLMIYLKTATEAYPEARPAGAMFFSVQDAEVSTEEETAERIDAERLKKVRMKGLITAEPDVVRAMDRDRHPWSVDQVFNKDGSVSKSASWAVEEDLMRGLMDAAAEKAGELCADMRAGRIEAAPRGTEEDNVCRTCGYQTICHVRQDCRRPREEGITFREAAMRAKRKNTLRDEPKSGIIFQETIP